MYSTAKIKKITHEHECPDFIDIVAPIKETAFQELLGVTEHTYTIDEQIIDWLDDHDKMDWMISNDVQTIINYEVVKAHVKTKSLRKLEKQESDLDIMKYLFGLVFKHNDEMKIDAVAVYSHLYLNIKKMKTDTQLSLVVKTMGIGYKSQIEAYRNMKDIMSSDTTEEMRDKIESNGHIRIAD